MDERSGTHSRRERILEAALFLALRHGLAGVTMEAIAREAKIAKPTLYGYFSNKDAVFVGVMEALIVDMRTAFDAAMAADAPLVDRIAAALTAKHATAFRLLEGSPHSDALYSQHDRVAGPQFRALEEAIGERLAGDLAAAGVAQAAALARLLMAATQGVAERAGSNTELSDGIGLVTRRLLAPDLSR